MPLSKTNPYLQNYTTKKKLIALLVGASGDKNL